MKFFNLIFMFFALNSCSEKELSVELPYQGDKMIVYCLLCPSEIISVKITKTYPPTGKVTYIDGISDAEVLLYENEKFIEKLTYTEKGIYKSETNFKPKTGSAYSLKINSPTLPSVITSQEIIPTLPKIISYKFEEKIESSLNKGKSAKKFILKIQDINNEVNFFAIKVEGFWQNNKSGLVDFTIDQANSSESACYFKYFSNFVFSDACFQNSNYEFKRGFELDPIFILNNNDFIRKDLEKVVAQVKQINKSYYEFCKTFYNEEDLLQAFNTPHPRYNNIKGGYGIFAAYNEILIELPVK